MSLNPSLAERLDAAVAELEQIRLVVEKIWLERQQVYATYRAIQVLQRSLEAARADLTKPAAR